MKNANSVTDSFIVVAVDWLSPFHCHSSVKLEELAMIRMGAFLYKSDAHSVSCQQSTELVNIAVITSY